MRARTKTKELASIETSKSAVQVVDDRLDRAHQQDDLAPLELAGRIVDADKPKVRKRRQQEVRGRSDA